MNSSPSILDARLPERFWSKVQIDPASGCWLWTGARTPGGYGVIGIAGERRNVVAHRLSYETLVDRIPAGREIDHLCRVRRCVNPAHLEPVTRRENLLRGDRTTRARNATHCPNGHLWSENAAMRTNGRYRYCRGCQRQHMANWLARGKAA